MITRTFTCDRCGHIGEPGEWMPVGWVEMFSDGEFDEDNIVLHFCGWACALHGVAEQLDQVEAQT